MTRKIRPAELVAICPDLRGKEGLAIAVTLVVAGTRRLRETFPHGPKPRELADALELAAAWIRAMEELI